MYSIRLISYNIIEGQFRKRSNWLLGVSSRFASSSCSSYAKRPAMKTLEKTQNNVNSSMSGSLSSLQSADITRFDNIIKSEEDKRLYRGLKLENGIKVILISDGTTDKSACCLACEIGHMSDEDNIPGLAHFVEHMLFLGTKKYPNENEYSSFLSKNSGSSNAATYPDLTKFYFDIMPEKFEDAIDRFSQFFICPLFTESATLREINAVHSEHEKNLATDVWRIRQVHKALSNQNHPFSKFGTGNKETLLDIPKKNGIDTRTELIKFHDKYYSSNLMTLAIFGKESLDELEELVIKYFSGIENKNVQLPVWSDKVYLDEQKMTKTYIVPIKDTRNLTISFQIPDMDEHFRSGPEHYISHLVGHEGKGSILSELKSRGWCNNLVGGASSSAKGFGFFEISVDLTEEGFENIDDIIKLLFQYLNLLRETGPQKWIFDEYCKLNEMQFRFKDKETPLTLVSNIVHQMITYPLPDVLSANYILTEWRPDLIEDVLSRLKPENCRITIVGQKIADKCNETEKWYKTKYHSEKINSATVNEWTKCGTNENLHLPEPNLFIPSDFNLLPLETTEKIHPFIIHDMPWMRVWYKQDNEFFKPKMFIGVDFSNPVVYSDPLNCNLTHLFVSLFKDSVNEFLYAAELAGLRFNISNTTNGISMLISGYSDKQSKLLETILEKLFNFDFDDKRFDIMCEQYERGLKNFSAEQPYQLAIYHLAVILTEQAWTKRELIDAMKLVTADRLRDFIKDTLSRLHAEAFIYGNVNKEKATQISKLIENKLKDTNAYILPQLARQLILKREYKLNEGEKYLFETQNEFHKSSCSSLYLQCGVQEDKSNVFLDLVAQILSEPCYNVLRTQDQLGYIVFSGVRKANGANGMRIIVQSTKNLEYVDYRIEKFLESMISEIEKMSEEEFLKHKEALKAAKLEKPKRLSSQYLQYINEISLQQYHFDRSEKEVEILASITKDQVLDYYKDFIAPNTRSQRSILIHIVSNPENIEHVEIPEEEAKPQHQPIPITDLAIFKSSKQLYPLAKSYIDIVPKGAKRKMRLSRPDPKSWRP